MRELSPQSSYVDLQPYIAPPAPPAPAVPPYSVERGGNVIGTFPDAQQAVTLAKAISRDGVETVVKVQGVPVAGYIKGARSFTVFDGAGNFGGSYRLGDPAADQAAYLQFLQAQGQAAQAPAGDEGGGYDPRRSDWHSTAIERTKKGARIGRVRQHRTSSAGNRHRGGGGNGGGGGQAMVPAPAGGAVSFQQFLQYQAWLKQQQAPQPQGLVQSNSGAMPTTDDDDDLEGYGFGDPIGVDNQFALIKPVDSKKQAMQRATKRVFERLPIDQRKIVDQMLREMQDNMKRAFDANVSQDVMLGNVAMNAYGQPQLTQRQLRQYKRHAKVQTIRDLPMSTQRALASLRQQIATLAQIPYGEELLNPYAPQSVERRPEEVARYNEILDPYGPQSAFGPPSDSVIDPYANMSGLGDSFRVNLPNGTVAAARQLYTSIATNPATQMAASGLLQRVRQLMMSQGTVVTMEPEQPPIFRTGGTSGGSRTR